MRIRDTRLLQVKGLFSVFKLFSMCCVKKKKRLVYHIQTTKFSSKLIPNPNFLRVMCEEDGIPKFSKSKGYKFWHFSLLDCITYYSENMNVRPQFSWKSNPIRHDQAGLRQSLNLNTIDYIKQKKKNYSLFHNKHVSLVGCMVLYALFFRVWSYRIMLNYWIVYVLK